MTRETSLGLAGTALSGLLVLAASSAAPQGPPARVLAFQQAVKGTEDTELRSPVAVAAASGEEFAVADAFGPRLLRFRRVGVSWQLDRAVTLPGAPVGLIWDGTRYVASLRQGAGLVALEGQELVLRRLPLPRGVVPGPLAGFSDGDLLVFDYAGARALRLGRSGEVGVTIAIAGGVTALATSATGGFFAAVAETGSVLQFDASGTLASTWALPAFEQVPAWPTGLAVEPAGDLLVVDRHNGRLLVVDATGQVVGLGSRRGWDEGLLLFPAGVARLPDGVVLVADEGNGRVQLFRRTDRGTSP